MARAGGNRSIVFRSPSRVRCQELWAVLDAAGIDSWMDSRGGLHRLIVREDDLPQALHELEDYGRETERPPPEPALLDPLPGGWLGVLAYSATLVAVSALAGRHVFAADWYDAGRAQAGAMLDGEWWRAFTALTLHVDSRHLLGNLCFGSVLGFLASQGLGGGVAWLAIVAGGATGNLANALLQPPQHAAVGASTAVFAALGLLVALALHHRRRGIGGVVRRWSPLVAGILLLAWTGMGGERTDVLAHVTGLLAGLVVGAAAGFAPAHLLERRSVQIGAAALALLAPLLAWSLAID